MTEQIDPRENADTATQTDGTNVSVLDAEAPNDTNTTHVAGYPVTDTILRDPDGEPYAAFGNAKAGPRTITYNLGYRYGLADRAVIAITIREELTPRNPSEAVVALRAPVAEAYCFGSFHTAVSIARSMCGGYAAKLAANIARNAARKARKRAQNAPEAPDAANTNPDTAERF